MSLKRKPSMLGQCWNMFIALAILASQAFVVWRIVETGNWQFIISPILVLEIFFGMITLMVDGMLLAVPYFEFKRASALNGAYASNDALAAPWDFPLDPALALSAGKTLTLARPSTQSGRAQVLGNIIAYLVVMVILSASGEALILPAFPSVGSWITGLPTNLLSITTPPTLAPLDWAALAMPMVLILIFSIVAAISSWRNSNLHVIADDAGITLRARARHEYIPWHDIVVCLKTNVHQDRGISGTYQLRGREHALDFTIGAPDALIGTNKLSTAASNAILLQYQSYTDDAKMLIATLIARSSVTIRTIKPGRKSRLMKGNAAFEKLSAEEINQFPLALNQPVTVTPNMYATMHSITRLTFEQRMPFWHVLPRTLLSASLFCAVMYGIAVRMAPDYNLKPEDLAAPAMLTFGGLLFLIAGVYSYLMVWTQWQTKVPTVIATASDITTKNHETKIASTVRWAEVRAWGVHLPRDPATMPTRYIIATEFRTLTWIEQPNAKLSGRMVRGDRKAAYRTMAAQLHALIVAKTNLPFHEFVTPPTA